MVFAEGLNSLYYGIATAAEFTRKMGVDVLKGVGVIEKSSPQEVKIPSHLQNLNVSRLVYIGSPIIRVAAMSGAMAVVLGAYGAHTLAVKEDVKEREMLFQTANRYHFFHTLALLGVPMCRLPLTTATFMSLGMVLFSGTCYYQALTGDKSLSKLTPVGGTCLILGWLCMMI